MTRMHQLSSFIPTCVVVSWAHIVSKCAKVRNSCYPKCFSEHANWEVGFSKADLDMGNSSNDILEMQEEYIIVFVHKFTIGLYW